VTGLCCHGSISVPETWLKFTNDNIERSRSERKASSDLRALAKETLDNCAAALLHQWHATNDALTERVRQYTEAKHKLQNHLSKVYELLLSFQSIFYRAPDTPHPSATQLLCEHAPDYCVRRSSNDANSGDCV
jgi:inorganic triphosphatase YgiF